MARDEPTRPTRRPVHRPLISPSAGRGRIADLSSLPWTVARHRPPAAVGRPAPSDLRVPRRVRPRVRDRAHVLLDENPAMEPFWRDADFLLGLLTGLMGAIS